MALEKPAKLGGIFPLLLEAILHGLYCM